MRMEKERKEYRKNESKRGKGRNTNTTNMHIYYIYRQMDRNTFAYMCVCSNINYKKIYKHLEHTHTVYKDQRHT